MTLQHVEAKVPNLRLGRAAVASRRPRAGTTRTLRGIVGAAVLLSIFEVAVRTGVLDRSVIPSVVEIAGALVELVREGRFWSDLFATLQAWAIALIASAFIGTVVGIAIGRSRFLYAGMRPIVDGMRSTSAVALIPLAVLVFGLGTGMKASLAIYAALWPMMLGGIHGSAGIERTLKDVTRILHWSTAKRARLLIFPSTLPYLAAALRTSSLVALVVVVSAEIVTGSDGLGRLVAATQRSGVGIDRMYATIAAIGIIGLVLDSLLARVEQRVVRWNPSNREA